MKSEQERSRRSKGLQSEEEIYKNIVELTSDIIYTSDSEGKQSFMNSVGYRILEVTPEEVVGEEWLNFIHHDDRKETLIKFQDMLKKGVDVFGFENRFVSKSGRVLHVLHNVRVVRDKKGKIIGTQGIARDITDRKKIEDELRLLQEINSMLNYGVEIDAVFKKIAEGLRSLYGYDSVAIHILSDDKTKVIIKSYSADSRAAGELEKLTGLRVGGAMVHRCIKVAC